jgi:hypothetical protein
VIENDGRPEWIRTIDLFRVKETLRFRPGQDPVHEGKLGRCGWWCGAAECAGETPPRQPAGCRPYGRPGDGKVALTLCDLEAFAALFAVAVQRIENDGVRFRWWADLIHLDGFAFELFVVLKKAAEHEQAVRRHLGGLAVGIELGIFGGNGDDFVILLAGVNHGHQPNGAGVNDGEWNYRLLAEHQHIERVVVFGEGLRDESVVGRIVDGRVEDTVEADQAAGLVQFILHAGTEGDFDNAIEFVRQFVAGSYVMPRMDHRESRDFLSRSLF